MLLWSGDGRGLGGSGCGLNNGKRVCAKSDGEETPNAHPASDIALVLDAVEHPYDSQKGLVVAQRQRRRCLGNHLPAFLCLAHTQRLEHFALLLFALLPRRILLREALELALLIRHEPTGFDVLSRTSVSSTMDTPSLIIAPLFMTTSRMMRRMPGAASACSSTSPASAVLGDACAEAPLGCVAYQSSTMRSRFRFACRYFSMQRWFHGCSAALAGESSSHRQA